LRLRVQSSPRRHCLTLNRTVGSCANPGNAAAAKPAPDCQRNARPFIDHFSPLRMIEQRFSSTGV
jgi:hypothetical protein